MACHGTRRAGVWAREECGMDERWGQRTVLLAGANEGRRLQLCRLLRRYGYAVQLVTTPREILHLVAMETPGLLLLDQASLGGAAQQVIRSVRAAEVYMAVVVLTTFGDDDDTITCLRAGATDYI